PVRASAVASGGISRVPVQSAREDNRGSAKRDAKFAVEICPAPRVISPLSIAQGDPASLLSRALLHSIAEAQKTFSSPSAPIPLSPDEADSQPQELSPSIHSPTLACGDLTIYSGASPLPPSYLRPSPG
ncbi:hypothetical protein PENTCL1PPCAC_25647, partial [Pristionchus entomophagus]